MSASGTVYKERDLPEAATGEEEQGKCERERETYSLLHESLPFLLSSNG